MPILIKQHYWDGTADIINPYYYIEKTELEFEGSKYVAPYKWHEALTDRYGDYMVPPPEDQRGGHADEDGKIIFDVNKGFIEY